MAGNFTPPTKCLRCQGTMEQGLGVTKDMAELSSDFIFEDNLPYREHWQKSELTSAKFLGRVYQGYKLIGPRLTILQYRCVDCGFLESYAPGADPGK